VKGPQKAFQIPKKANFPPTAPQQQQEQRAAPQQQQQQRGGYQAKKPYHPHPYVAPSHQQQAHQADRPTLGDVMEAQTAVLKEAIGILGSDVKSIKHLLSKMLCGFEQKQNGREGYFAGGSFLS
jgi:hypothetical protein